MARKPQTTPDRPKTSDAVRSMTGFGRATVSDGLGRVNAEVRSVNGRFLKLTVKLPPRYGALEERVRALLAAHGVTRGSVEVGLYFDEPAAAGASLDEAVLRKYARQAGALAKTLRLKDARSLQALLGLPGVVTFTGEGEDPDRAWKRCEPPLLQALARFDAMRLKEGLALAADTRGRLADLRDHWRALAEAAPRSKQAAMQKFRDRVTKALAEAALASTPAPESLEREIVLLCDRLDVSEELARLDSHLNQMEGILGAGGEVGKKLDFLTQEVLREINTLGSKSQDQAVTHRVVEMKGLVEQVREQIQNLL